MAKDEEDRLVNAIIALHQVIEKQGKKSDEQLAKINLALNEMRLSYMKTNEKLDRLSSEMNKYAASNNALMKGHDKRITRLENKTFGGSFLAEPRAVYKKRKKK